MRLIPLPASLVGKLLRCGGGMIIIETFERGRPNSREQGGYLNFEGVRIAHRSGLDFDRVLSNLRSRVGETTAP